MSYVSLKSQSLSLNRGGLDLPKTIALIFTSQFCLSRDVIVVLCAQLSKHCFIMVRSLMLIFLKYQGLPYTVHVMWISYNKYHFSVQGLAFVAANHILI